MQERPQRHAATALLAAAIALTLPYAVGCGSSWFASDENASADMRPEDFVGEPRPTPPTDAQDTPTSLVATDTTDDNAGADDTSNEPTNANNSALAVNAMVGHINGEAVYADQIFDVNVAAQLANYGQRFSQEDFLKQAALVIQDKLGTIIKDKLILGEAERNLTDRQRMGIEYFVRNEREELIRFYGQGSLSLTKARFREAKGIAFEDYLRNYREQRVINSYIRLKVSPKIVVNDRDIAQWYNANLQQYRQPDQRAFRILRVADNDTAQRVAARLKRGERFEDVAADAEVNLYNPAGTGLFNNGEPLSGDRIYAIEPVNDALIELEQGEHAGPIPAGKHQYFVQLVELIPGVNRTLQDPDVQFEIRRILELRQFEKHANRFTSDLVARGSYTDQTEMKVKLLEIAYARYER